MSQYCCSRSFLEADGKKGSDSGSESEEELLNPPSSIKLLQLLLEEDALSLQSDVGGLPGNCRRSLDRRRCRLGRFGRTAVACRLAATTMGRAAATGGVKVK